MATSNTTTMLMSLEEERVQGKQDLAQILEMMQQQRVWQKQITRQISLIQDNIQTKTPHNDRVYDTTVPKRCFPECYQKPVDGSSSSEDEIFKNEEFQRIQLSSAIKSHMVEIVACLPFSESDIPDVLIPDCISENECEKIRNIGRRKDEIRSVVRLVIKRDFRTMMKFIRVIQNNNSKIGKSILDAFRKRLTERTDTDKRRCTVCTLNTSVNIKDVCDVYYSKNYMSDQLHEDITEASTTYEEQEGLWRRLFGEISCFPTNIGMQIMKEALELKGPVFSHIVEMVQKDIKHNRGFICTCRPRIQMVPNLRKAPSSICSTATSVFPRSSFCESMESFGSVSTSGNRSHFEDNMQENQSICLTDVPYGVFPGDENKHDSWVTTKRQNARMKRQPMPITSRPVYDPECLNDGDNSTARGLKRGRFQQQDLSSMILDSHSRAVPKLRKGERDLSSIILDSHSRAVPKLRKGLKRYKTFKNIWQTMDENEIDLSSIILDSHSRAVPKLRKGLESELFSRSFEFHRTQSQDVMTQACTEIPVPVKRTGGIRGYDFWLVQ